MAVLLSLGNFALLMIVALVTVAAPDANAEATSLGLGRQNLTRWILHAPDENEFFKRLSASDRSLSRNQELNLVQEFANARHPAFSKDQLLDVFISRRESIKTIRWKKKVLYTDDYKDITSYRSVAAIRSGDGIVKTFTFSPAQVIRPADAPHVLAYDLSNKIIAFDGRYLRTFQVMAQDKRGDGTIAKKSSSDVSMVFFGVDGLLAQSMIFDSTRLPNFSNWPYIDIVALLRKPGSAVFMEAGNNSHSDEIVVANMIWRVYINPIHFVITHLKCMDIPTTGTSARVPVVSYTRDLNDYFQYGKNVFFPSRVTERRFANGKLVNITKLKYYDIQVNEPVTPKEFTDIFPPNTRIMDFRQMHAPDQQQVQKSFTAVENAVNHGVSGRHAGNYWWLYVIACLVGAIGGAIVMRWAHKKHNENI